MSNPKSGPTPLKWMGRTVEQEHILRWIDRENPFGEILCIQCCGPRELIVTDMSCFEHRLRCRADGLVEAVGEEDTQCSA